jgi:cell division initiation protein
MRITPHDIRQQQFSTRLFKGYDPVEVDAFLDDVAEDFEAMLKEIALLKEQMAAQEERQRGVVEREKSLQDVLLTTQRLSEEMKAAARREADLVVREAELRGEKLVEESRAEEAKIRVEIQALRRTRRHLTEDLAATIERYQRLFASEADADAADGARPA